MRQSREDSFASYAALIAALIIIAMIAGSYLTIPKTASSVPPIYGDDFTIQSITPTQIISNDNDLNSANFIISAIANGGNQRIVGSFDSAEFKQFTGYDITYPLQIGISDVSETLTYPISNDGNPLYKYRAEPVNRPSYWTGATCPDKVTDGYDQCLQIVDNGISGFNGADTIVKIYKDIVGSTGSFDNPSTSWGGAITMTIAGVSITKEISSAATQGIEFYAGNEWKGTVRWTGSVITGNPTADQSFYKAIYLKSRGSWRISQTRYYNDVANAIFQIPSVYEPNTGNRFYSMSGINEAISTYNSKVDILTNQDDRISYTGATAVSFSQSTSGGETNGNVISKGLPTGPTAYPMFQFIVKAKSLGVQILTGKPKITSVEVPTFSSGDNSGTLTVKFTNIGSATGSFTASITQINPPFYQQGTATPVTVPPLGTGTISLMIGHGTAGSGSVSGIVRVSDTNKPSNYDEKPFSTTMTAPKACIPGSFDPRGNLIYSCKTDGSGYELFLNCQNGQTPVFQSTANTYACQNPSPLSTPSQTNNRGIGTGNFLNWYETPQAILLSFLIMALILVGYVKYKEKR